ncbi:tRNA threonylcarbamoyl adenosine modification protein YeaZ [Lachnotalea glycerini]|uniref:tRNA (Adenosine(37)-N6)-threonylcarbamoyltransferase complex dimerization subunit type 1 TsaB n=1 Tax=Lachnotalea glycerini TaxID=1763509 RepID=A0A255IJ61_9FIRM|nr:tRNA (adenosine(37)-N6)-threonylcarbamoyltransferase complex dimerization subunit type 1 TsaB [Lachnotalea glycerini]PXV86734.1 tRNA threonylcarbamoyl adenosine modification protein YeaZ [Lachnotalea glycerini]RDY32238.1 tRNA (adenosine(37)-N6)-threonylcarbamoyltransferase complex dimerization subunit type 1 TsaB [Lachnotalea glycerini]
MKILAIDSSGLVASAAIIEDENMVAEYTINYKKTHSQTLLPMIQEIVQMTDTDLATIDAIAVAGGPGSFTGLRIGSATAKGLGLALDKPLISVPTVDGLAYNLYGTDKIICPVMDAKRNQVYTGLYEFQGSEFHVIEQQMAVSIDEIIGKINEIGRPVIFVGDGISVFANQIANQIAVEYFFAPAHLNKQRAATVGTLAKSYLLENKIESALEHKPDYLRLSQAERERLEKK